MLYKLGYQINLFFSKKVFVFHLLSVILNIAYMVLINMIYWIKKIPL